MTPTENEKTKESVARMETQLTDDEDDEPLHRNKKRRVERDANQDPTEDRNEVVQGAFDHVIAEMDQMDQVEKKVARQQQKTRIAAKTKLRAEEAKTFYRLVSISTGFVFVIFPFPGGTLDLEVEKTKITVTMGPRALGARDVQGIFDSDDDDTLTTTWVEGHHHLSRLISFEVSLPTPIDTSQIERKESATGAIFYHLQHKGASQKKVMIH
jgi:hypothetical protein